MLLNKLKLLENNPRQITEKQFFKLKKSLKEFLEMLEVRQIVYDDNFVIWGGNQRFRAYKMLVEQGEVEYNKKYFKKLPKKWTLKQKREFAIKDNNPTGLSGSFDDDILANEWDNLPLDDWGINTGVWENLTNLEEKSKLDNKKLIKCPNCGSEFTKSSK